jgi:hypothetical protein
MTLNTMPLTINSIKIKNMKKFWPFEDISIFRNEGCWGKKGRYLDIFLQRITQ